MASDLGPARGIFNGCLISVGMVATGVVAYLFYF